MRGQLKLVNSQRANLSALSVRVDLVQRDALFGRSAVRARGASFKQVIALSCKTLYLQSHMVLQGSAIERQSIAMRPVSWM
jgi:hypothetical protein